MAQNQPSGGTSNIYHIKGYEISSSQCTGVNSPMYHYQITIEIYNFATLLYASQNPNNCASDPLVLPHGELEIDLVTISNTVAGNQPAPGFTVETRSLGLFSNEFDGSDEFVPFFYWEFPYEATVANPEGIQVPVDATNFQGQLERRKIKHITYASSQGPPIINFFLNAVRRIINTLINLIRIIFSKSKGKNSK